MAGCGPDGARPKNPFGGRWRNITADPDDDKFVDCAIAAEAEWIITEDGHLSVLAASGYKPRAITPAEFILRFSHASRMTDRFGPKCRETVRKWRAPGTRDAAPAAAARARSAIPENILDRACIPRQPRA